MDINLNDDYKKYINEIHNEQLCLFEAQYEFSNKLIKFSGKENNNGFDFKITSIDFYKKENINKKYIYFLNSNNLEVLLLYLENNNLIEKRKIKRRNGSLFMNKKINKYFIKYSFKWSKKYIRNVSKKTNLNLKPVYKWNWNKINFKNKNDKNVIEVKNEN